VAQADGISNLPDAQGIKQQSVQRNELNEAPAAAAGR
jgi:hypothetical protein